MLFDLFLVERCRHNLSPLLPHGSKADRQWPKRLQISYKLGLPPFVRQLRICEVKDFTPRLLGKCAFHYFSAFERLQELGIDRLNASKFIPCLKQCFGHLAETLGFLVGLFSGLQDLKLCFVKTIGVESTDDPRLVPLSTPPLVGRLILSYAEGAFIESMINVFGRLRFRCMDLFDIEGAKLLLGACANTLKTLRLYPTDPCGLKGAYK